MMNKLIWSVIWNQWLGFIWAFVSPHTFWTIRVYLGKYWIFEPYFPGYTLENLVQNASLSHLLPGRDGASLFWFGPLTGQVIAQRQAKTFPDSEGPRFRGDSDLDSEENTYRVRIRSVLKGTTLHYGLRVEI